MRIRYPNWTRYLGAATALLVTVVTLGALAISICREMGGAVTSFGWSCGIPRCLDEYPLWNYAPIELGVAILIFVGIPIGLLTTVAAVSWFRGKRNDG